MNEKKNDSFDLLVLLLQKWWVIAIAVIVCGGIAFLYTKFVATPLYSSSGILYINANSLQTTSAQANNSDVDVTAVVNSQRLVETYMQTLHLTPFLETVNKDIEGKTVYKYTPEALKKSISLSSIEDTFFFSVTVTSADPHDSYLIATSALNNASDAILAIIDGGSVRIGEPANESSTPISPSVPRNMIIGIVLGLIIGVLIVLLREMFDTRVKSSDILSDKLNLTILGEIPSLTPNK